MNPKSSLASFVRFTGLAALAVALAGCERNDVKVLVVPKEGPAPGTASSSLPPGHPDTSMTVPPGMDFGMDQAQRPRITYKKPEGWVEAAPGSVRVASFRIVQGDKQADVSVIPLAGAAGGDLANVNRWRGQVGLEPVDEAQLKVSATEVEIAGAPGQLYDLAGSNPGSGEPSRVLGAIQHRDGMAWFFKISGDDQLVAAQKPALVEFLKSIAFQAPEAAALPPSHPPIGGMAAAGGETTASAVEGRPSWQVPAGWNETPGGQFLVAKFLIQSGDAQAAVNVSASAGDGGGFANNVNRWRGQLGLGPMAEAEINSQSRVVDVAGGKATFIELSGTDPRTGQQTRVVGAMVPQGGQTYFYKLAGAAAIVEAQKSAFETFVTSAKY